MNLTNTFRAGIFALAMTGLSAFGIGMCSAPAAPFRSPIGRHDDDIALADDPPRPGRSNGRPDPDGDISYEMNAIGRQVGGPLVNGLLQPVASKWNSEGSFRLRYAHHAINPSDPVFRGWERRIYKNGTKVGSASQTLFLPSRYRGRELAPAEVSELRRSGARLQARAGMSIMPSQALRLATNIAAIGEMSLEGCDGYTAAEKGTVLVDTASVASNGADSIMYVRGLRLIAGGREGAAGSAFVISHRINVASSALQVVAGAMRIYAEISRKDQRSEFNPSSVFYGFMDMAGGFNGMVFSLFLLGLARRLNRSGAASTPEGTNNVLMGLTELPGRIQNGIRLIAGASAVAGLFINGVSIVEALGDPGISQAARDSVLFSGSVGIVGSAFSLAGSAMITPAGAPLAGTMFTASSAFLACQTMHDFWPIIKGLHPA